MRRALAAVFALGAWLALGAAANEPAAAPQEAAPASPSEPAAPEPETRAGPVLVARLDGTINPASADYLVNAIRAAESAQAVLLLVELDTPGGTIVAMEDIVQAMLRARVPIAVYVTPSGGLAASAGTYITLAAHIAAMAPETSIGAAHPVNPFGDNQRLPQDPASPAPPPPSDIEIEKAENILAALMESIAKKRGRNVEWAVKAVRESVAVGAEEAAKLNVIDLVAVNRGELLAALDGRIVDLTPGRVRLVTQGADIRELEMGLLARFLHTIWDPQIAFMFLAAGAVLLYIEFSTPGLTVPGVLGALCLVVFAVSLQVLPFQWLGLILFVGGLALFGAEILLGTYGVLFAAGIVCMLFGGSLIFDRPDASDLNLSFWTTVAPVVGTFALFGGFVAFAVGRVLRKPSKLGEGELLGMRGVASSALAPSGTVALRGELWSADADDRIAEGEAVEVIAIDGMRLRVRRAIRRA